MLNWLKFTFGSYYSNKTSKEGSTRSFWNVIFALSNSLNIKIKSYKFGAGSPSVIPRPLGKAVTTQMFLPTP